MGTREPQWLVKVILVMARPRACAAGNMAKIINTLEMVDTVSFAGDSHDDGGGADADAMHQKRKTEVLQRASTGVTT